MELARLGLFNFCVKSREKLLVAARGDECDGLERTTEFKVAEHSLHAHYRLS